jgi:hypothetical protein
LTIVNPSAGEFKLGLKSPLETTTWYSNPIPCNLNSASMRTALQPFFAAATRTSSDIAVSRVMYDSSNSVTTTASAATKYIYTIKLKKRITGFSFSTATVSPIGTITSTVSVQPPSGATGIKSSVPLAGNFKVECTTSDGVVHTSPSIANSQWFMRGKVRFYDVWNGNEADNWKNSYRENGRNMIAIFDGFNENPPLC